MSKRTISIPQPAFQQTRLAPAGKHSRGRAPKRQLGQVQQPPLALGKQTATTRAKAKDDLWRTSCADANRIHREQQHKRELARWFASLSPQDQEFARAHGLHKPLGSNTRPAGPRDPDIDFCDPSDLAEASINSHPVDTLEPQRNSVEVDDLSYDQIEEASEHFGAALRWALDGGDLVAIGRRGAAIINLLRPDLGVGLPCAAGALELGACKITGTVFGRVLEWIRRGSSLSAIGERIYLAAYVLRPALINSSTLQAIGDLTNKTRQAKDKLAQCLRDTFSGLKAMAMRPDITRSRCREAQLAVA